MITASTLQTKLCRGCDCSKDLSEFYHVRKSAKPGHGYSSRCKRCRNSAIYAKRKDETVGTRYRSYKNSSRRKERTGWKSEAYLEAYEKQEGVCAICGLPSLGRDLAADHDHETHQTRGLLCSDCNLGLGCFVDSIPRLLSAVAYLQKYRPEVMN